MSYPKELSHHKPSLMEIVQNPGLRQDLNRRLGDYCHHSRNRLNSLKLCLYLARRQTPRSGNQRWQALESDYQQIESQLDQVQVLCQPLSLSMTTIKLALLFEDRRERWTNLLAAAGKNLVFRSPQPSDLARFDVNRLGGALDALVAWRAVAGTVGSITTVSWGVQDNQAQIRWTESFSSQSRSTRILLGDDQNWSLPILARVVQEHHGTLEVEDHHDWVLQINWPRDGELSNSSEEGPADVRRS